ncbi:hypothetical protein PQX77_005315 [Marasmius sp. AFHP31]|nr:hypothetical protein PQX77_005315 [Marasmius sp. AFHP31]
MHQFEVPPRLVLDLGCGSGLWAIEAAKQWPESTIIGLDMRSIQPKLLEMEAFKGVAHRLKWIHGNFLDGLHFPPDHFDLVRIARIGLGVPEDEWQFVLEEVSRVMKPGAVLEIIEEDLIFPSGEISRSRPRPTLTIDLPISDSIPSARSSIASANPWISSQDDLSETSTKRPNLSPLQESPTSTSSPPSAYPMPKSPLSLRTNSSYTLASTLSSTPIPSSSYQSHPQDHSRLQSAWDAMLSHRFLPSQLTTVLPFYLSSCFTDVQSHLPLNIPLPPNSPSSRVPRSRDSELLDVERQFSLHPAGKRISDSDEFPRNGVPGVQKHVQNLTTMHLARTVQIITGCKEAIWVEYERMYTPDLPPVTSSRRKDGRYQFTNNKTIARESFDRAWTNWESDMTDRIGLRDSMLTHLAWSESPGERPEWRIWRNAIDIKPVDEAKAQKDLCRSLRGFVAWKPR